MERLRIYLVLLFWGGFASLLHAQVSGSGSYALSPIQFNWDSTGTPQTLNLTDNIFGSPIPLPFPFCYYGQTFTACQITDNGFLTFHGYAPGSFVPLAPWYIMQPSQVPSTAIMATWQDMIPQSTAFASINWHISGASPNRKFVVTWKNLRNNNDTTRFYGQIHLFESTNWIEIHIQKKVGVVTQRALAGISAYSGLLDVIPGRSNTTFWSAYQESWRFTPLLPPCGPPPIGGFLGGKVYYDQNANCTFNAGDKWMEGVAVTYDPWPLVGKTDQSGTFLESLPAGICQIAAKPHPRWQIQCPALGQYQAMAIGGVSATNHFFALTGPNCPDLLADLSTYQILPCTTQIFSLSYGNQGVQPSDSVSLTIDLGDSLDLLSSALPYSNPSQGIYTFQVGTLSPGQRESLPILVASGCAPANSLHCFSATITGQSGTECDLKNNTIEECLKMQANAGGNTYRLQDMVHHSRTWATYDTMDTANSTIFKIQYEYTQASPLLTLNIETDFPSILDPASITFLGGNLDFIPYYDQQKLHFFASVPDLLSTQSLPRKGYLKFRMEHKSNPDICAHEIQSKGTVIFNRTIQAYLNEVKAVPKFTPYLNWPPVVCIKYSKINLSGGFPPGGHYAGPGIHTITQTFRANDAGAGTHTLNYTWFCGSLTGTVYANFTVISNPTVSWSQTFPPLCREDTTPIPLIPGYPPNGYFKGAGVSGSTLYPAFVPPGTSTVNYVVDIGLPGCTAYQTRTLTIHPTPDTPSVVFIPPNQAASLVQHDSLQWFINGIMAGWTDEYIPLTTPGAYSIKIYENDCPSLPSNEIEWPMVGIDHGLDQDWQIGPNPTTGAISITPPQNNSWNLHIFDGLGTLQLSRSNLSGPQLIELHEVPAGTYLLILQQGNWEKNISVQVLR